MGARLQAGIATFGAAINVITTGIIQVKQGIGDVIWHLPFIRAIAAAAPGGAVTFFAPPSSHAAELLQAEPAVAETIYFRHAGSELQRGLNLVRLVTLLRRRRLRSLWILDRTLRPAVAAWLAGIPERIGLGLGAQRRFITNAGIDGRHFHDQPIDWLRALMATMQLPLASTEPSLRLPAALISALGERFGACPRPWIVLGIGASHPSKDWSTAQWREFLVGLRQRIAGSIFLCGGAANTQRVDDLIACSKGAAAVNACGLGIAEVAALLRLADLFVGTDSGPMNLAAAAGIPAFALFGSTPVLSYSRFIHPVRPDGGGPSPDGMARISPAKVLAQIEPYCATR